MAQFCACLHSRPAYRQTSKHEFYFTLIYLPGQPTARRSVAGRRRLATVMKSTPICCQNKGLFQAGRPFWGPPLFNTPTVHAVFGADSSLSCASWRMNTGMQMASPISPLVSPGRMVSSAPSVHSQRSQLFMPTSM